MEYLPEPAIALHEPRTYGGNAAFHNFHNDYSHITDPNLRRRLALAEVDKIPFGWYHVRAVVVAGIGFFTDSYDIFAINLVTTMLGMVFWQGGPEVGGNHGVLPTNINTAIKAATSGGVVVGQLLFGWLADLVGRRKMYGVELAIIVLATFVQALAAPSKAVTLTGLLIFWRVIMGIGIGGDYPLSAVITSEFAPTRWRGAMMAAVFSMQGLGQFVCALVALIVTLAFQESFINTTGAFSSCDNRCQLAGDRAWRIIVAFGALPALFALYYRITIPETPRYTFDIAHDIEKADADIKAYMNNEREGQVDRIAQVKTKQQMGKHLSTPKASWSDSFAYFSQWKNFKVIFGTTTSWFFLDLAFYGLGLNNTAVLSAIGFSSGNTIYETLRNNAVGNLVLVCAGSIPGYWLSVLTIDTLGRKSIQIVGFFLLTIIFSFIGFAYNHLSKGALFALYVLAQFFFNWGPNTTTFIIPGECFPTRYRATGHGMSAAMGKIGAIVAQVMAQPLLTKGARDNCKGGDCHPWLNHLMQIFALFMLCGTLVSFLVPETKGRTLEELAGEPSTALDRHGSLHTGSWWQTLNPFIGGHPAGFTWQLSPRLTPKSPSRHPRVGIMTSPDLVPKGANKHSTKHNRDESYDNGYSVSVSTNGNGHSNSNSNSRREADDDIYISGTGSPTMPGWGAGWAVQRNGNPSRDVRTQSIQLNDVGKLLK